MRHDVGGYSLAIDQHPAKTPRRHAVLLHGMTGTGADWHAILPAFQPDTTVTTVDLIAHGASDAPPDPGHYTFDATSQALARLADALRLPAAVWVGYSFGARLLVNFALKYPQRVGALVLESVHPGILDAVERKARADQDEADAHVLDTEGIEAFLERWHERPVFATRKRRGAAWEREIERKHKTNSALGLARCLRRLGLGSQPSLADRLSEIEVPTLLLAGTLDPPYLELARAMHNEMPHSRFKAILDAGHACHLENPEATQEALREFLDSLPSLSQPLAQRGGP